MLPDQLQGQEPRETVLTVGGEEVKYPARDIRETAREGGGNQGEGRKSSREEVRGRPKGPEVCGVCCGVCCGASRELVENLSKKGAIAVTSQVLEGLVNM